jgi:folate-dependent phosphoribosylglycinamide formyltransferase PurN
MKNDTRIILVTQESELTFILYNFLKDHFNITHVLYEQPVKRSLFLKRRVKRLGLLKVIGQIFFQVIVVSFLKVTSKKRIAEIKREYSMDDSPIDETKVIRHKSVNSKKSINFLKDENPDIVVVNGTRIISKKVLEAVKSTFVNIHCGITPLYRGSHGGYWALARRQPELCGVTIHYIDPGIDTGEVLGQALIHPTKKDNFYTYPYLQFGESLPVWKEVLTSIAEDRQEVKQPMTQESAIWSHPSLYEYVKYWVRYGVK